MMDDEAPTMLTTRIVIERHIGVDGEDNVTAEFVNGEGETPPLVEILGILEMTKDTAIHAAMGDLDEDDD